MLTRKFADVSETADRSKLSADAVLDSSPASETDSCGRAALEALASRTLSDLEWDRARARLLEFVSILRAWHQEITTSEPELLKAG